MKKTLILPLLLLATCLSSFAQTIVNPLVEGQDDWSSTITKIETDKQFTTVSFEYTANSDNSWAQLNKEIFIQTDQGNAHYDYVKSENIAIVPAKHTFAKAGEKLTFKVYFKKIPATAKSIDIIERAGRRHDGITFFNFYNVSLTQSLPAGTNKVKVTDVVLMPPPPILNGNNATMSNEMDNMANAMAPMYANMAKSVLNAQVDYYKQPGKIEELAKVNKQYFDALRKEGFTEDQALRIITTGGILSGATLGGGK